MVRRILPRMFALFSVMVVVAIVVAACGGGDDEEQPTARPQPTTAAPTATTAPRPTPTPAATPTAAPKRGGVLNVRDIREWTPFWDTWHNFGGFVPFIGNLVSNLVRYDYDDNTKIVGDLITEWSAAADGTSYTLKVRQGVIWHDGKPFTAQDVVWNLNRGIKPPDPTIRFNFTKFLSAASAEVVDPQTVKITMKQPSASFFPSLAAFSVLMYPPDSDGKLTGWQTTAIGTGPFKLKSWTKDSVTVLERNQNYYIKDAAGNALPYLDGMQIFVIAGDPALAFSAFRTGKIDCGCGHDHDFVTINSDIIKREFPAANLYLVLADQFNLVFNLTKPPFDNRDVREAFSMFLDRRAIVALPRGGKGYFPPAHMQQPDAPNPGQWGLPNAELLQFPGFREPFSAEVQRANDLLKKAGVDPKALSISFLGIQNPNVGPYHEAGASLIQNASGAKLNFKAEGTTALIQSLTNKAFDITMTSGGTAYDDPSAIFLEFIAKTGSRNYYRFDYGVDDLITQQEATLDFQKRREIVRQIQRKLIQDATLVPAVYQVDGWATHAYVKGWRPPFLSVGPQNRMERVWLDR